MKEEYFMGRGKNWTKEEDLYLEEYWGVKSIATIAKNLGRTKDAIMVRKNRLGLGRFLDNGEYITYSQLLKALYGSDSAGSAYRNFRRCGDFPIRKKREGRKVTKSYIYRTSGRGQKNTIVFLIFPRWRNTPLVQSLNG